MRKGITYSGVMHVVLLLIAAFGLPYCVSKRPPPEPYAVTVEILPITSQTNIKPSLQEPEKTEKEEEKKTPEPKKPEPPKPDEKKTNDKPVPKTKTEEAAKPKPEPLPLPKPEKKIEKKEEKKEVKKEEKKKEEEESLDDILKSVKKLSDSESKTDKKSDKKTKAATKSKSDNYNPLLPLSMSERDAIKNQISEKWNPPIGNKNAQTLVVTLIISISQDGTVTNVDLSAGQLARYASDSSFRTAADRAKDAAYLASPLKNLPPDKYDTWKEIELNFDPSELLR